MNDRLWTFGNALLGHLEEHNLKFSLDKCIYNPAALKSPILTNNKNLNFNDHIFKLSSKANASKVQRVKNYLLFCLY